MPYKAQIKKLEEAYKALQHINGTQSTTSQTKATEYLDEIRRLNRLQWDHDHNSIDMGDDH